MSAVILDNDEIARCVIYDRLFQGDIHVDEMLWPFQQSKADGAAHESAVLRRIAITSGDVHRIGCKTSETQNNRKGNPPPGKTRRYYCGFRNALVSNLILVGNNYRIVLTNLPENDEEAHIDVALFIYAEGKSHRANVRSEAGLALAEGFGPPEPHVCDCDRNDEEHPVIKHGEACLFGGLQKRFAGLDKSTIAIA